MADYGLPDPVLSYIQGAPVPDVAQPIAPPPMDPTGLHPAILSYLTGQPLGMADGSVHPNLAFQAAPQGDIYMGGPRGSDDSGTQAPPPPPPPPPPSGGSTKGPMKHMIGPSPIIAGVAGGPDAAPEIADAPVASVTGGNLPTKPTSLTPPPQQPDIPTTIAMPTPTQDAAVKKQVAAQDAFAASPEGLQQRADAMDQASIQKQQQANQMDAAAQEAEHTATSAALQAHIQRQADQAQADAQRQAAYQADVDKYTQQYAQQVQDAANYHVNDDRSVGTGGLIAIALSGIGNALDHIHGPNAAAQIIQNGIQQRIADQWRQKDALAKKATGTAAVLNQFRQNALDDRQAQALQTAAELQKTSDQLKLVAAQSANPQVQANAVKTSALLDQNSAAIVRGEAIRGAQAKQAAQDQAYRNADLGLRAQAHKDQVDYQNKMLDLERDRINAAKNGQQDKTKAAQDAATQKQLEGIKQNGIYDPETGDLMLDPQGQAKMAAAKQLDAQAQAQPDAAAQLHQQAEQLRQDAQLNNAYTINEPGAHKEVTDNVGYNYKLVKGIDQIRGEIAGDPSGFDRSKWQMIKSQWENIKKDYLKAAGSTELSSRSMQAVDNLMGPDPGSFGARETALSKMKSALEGVRGAALDDMKGTLKGRGIKYNVNVVDPLSLPAPVESDESVLKTPLEKPAPNAIESAQGLLALRDAEQMIHSGDAAKQQIGLRVLDSAMHSADRTTRDRAIRIHDNFITGGAPILPDPYKYPDYYKKD